MKRVIVCLAVGTSALFGFSSAAWAATGTENLTFFARDDQPATIFATGPITGVGQSVETGPDTETDVFPEGTIDVVHPVTSESDSFDPVACVVRARFSGTYTVTGGTGAFAGASGSGTFSGQFIGILGRTAEGCSEEPVESFSFVHASGPLTIP